MHVAARSVAAQGLSIFGDHSDVMAVRQTGFALLSFGVGTGGARLRARGPRRDARNASPVRALLRRLSHLARAADDRDARRRGRARADLRRAGPGPSRPALSPERPFIRGTAQNPDIYFQARETVNPFYARVPDVCRRDGPSRRAHRPPLRPRGLQRPPGGRAGARGDGLGRRDRRARPSPTCDAQGERVGVAQVRLYRPFPARELARRCPRASPGRRAGSHQGARARSASRCSSTCSRRSTRPTATGSAT